VASPDTTVASPDMASSDLSVEEEVTETEDDYDVNHWGNMVGCIGKISAGDITWSDKMVIYCIHTVHKKTGKKKIMLCDVQKGQLLPMNNMGNYEGQYAHPSEGSLYIESRGSFEESSYCMKLLGRAQATV
jgi:hypothetical protein